MELNLTLVGEDPFSFDSSSSVKAEVFEMVEMTENFLVCNIFLAIFCLTPESSMSLLRFR